MKFSFSLHLCFGLCLLGPSLAYAAYLDIPGNGSTLSGIGVISGWKCEATAITVVIDDGTPIPMLHGSERGDTRGACGNTNNGFLAIFNYALLADGEHTAVAYDNGKEFARSTFEVGTLGEEFVRGARAEVRVEDFPSPGESTLLVWNEASQHFEVAPEPSGGGSSGGSGGSGGVCRAGLVVQPGESCTHPTNGETFSVDASGTGRFMFFTAGGGINIVNSSINGQTITFVAQRNSGSDSWTVERVS